MNIIFRTILRQLEEIFRVRVELELRNLFVKLQSRSIYSFLSYSNSLNLDQIRTCYFHFVLYPSNEILRWKGIKSFKVDMNTFIRILKFLLKKFSGLLKRILFIHNMFYSNSQLIFPIGKNKLSSEFLSFNLPNSQTTNIKSKRYLYNTVLVILLLYLFLDLN